MNIMKANLLVGAIVFSGLTGCGAYAEGEDGELETFEESLVSTSFSPGTHGFNFGNQFKNTFVDVGIDDITTKGLCGGMVYAALDHYIASKAIPLQDYEPTTGTALRDYLYSRQVNSLLDNADKWAELTFNPFGWRNDEFFAWGLQTNARVKELRAAIDAGDPVPLGLRDGGGGGDHQVLAIGYDLGAYDAAWGGYPNLKIKVYDPNYPNKTRTIVANLTEKRWVDSADSSRKWISYFVDSKHNPVVPPNMASIKTGLVVSLTTGGDDMRGGNDNASIKLTMKDGTTKTFSNVNGSDRWLMGSTESVALSLSNPGDVTKVQLITTFNGDNWNLDKLSIKSIANSVSATPRLERSGSPLFRFAGSTSKTFDLPVTLVHAPNGDFSNSHENFYAGYRTWDGSSWCVSIYGNSFLHAPNCDWNAAHWDTGINYKTWDDSNWYAKINGKTFTHTRNGVSHTDSALNYRSTSNWTFKVK
jgi:hypothetical protein